MRRRGFKAFLPFFLVGAAIGVVLIEYRDDNRFTSIPRMAGEGVVSGLLFGGIAWVIVQRS